MRCSSCDADIIPGVDVCMSCGSELAGFDQLETQRGFSEHLLTDRIGDLELSDPIALAPETSVHEAVERMRRAHRGCVFVEQQGMLVGAFNERHLLTRVLLADLDPATTALSAVMGPVEVQLDPEDPPAFAVHCMVSRRLRHLPVVSDGVFVGFLSVRNILAYLNDELIRG